MQQPAGLLPLTDLLAFGDCSPAVSASDWAVAEEVRLKVSASGGSAA